ncbi:MAG: hypothetical protein ACLR6B_10415 [Blautia sp.]
MSRPAGLIPEQEICSQRYFLGALLKGLSLLEKAAEAAHRFVAHCIQKSDAAGYDTREGVLLEPELLELVKIVS